MQVQRRVARITLPTYFTILCIRTLIVSSYLVGRCILNFLRRKSRRAVLRLSRQSLDIAKGIISRLLTLLHLYLLLSILIRLLHDPFRTADCTWRSDPAMLGSYVKIKGRGTRVILPTAAVRFGFLDDGRLCSFSEFLDLGLNRVDIKPWTFRLLHIGDMRKQQFRVYFQIHKFIDFEGLVTKYTRKYHWAESICESHINMVLIISSPLLSSHL